MHYNTQQQTKPQHKEPVDNLLPAHAYTAYLPQQGQCWADLTEILSTSKGWFGEIPDWRLQPEEEDVCQANSKGIAGTLPTH